MASSFPPYPSRQNWSAWVSSIESQKRQADIQRLNRELARERVILSRARKLNASELKSRIRPIDELRASTRHGSAVPSNEITQIVGQFRMAQYAVAGRQFGSDNARAEALFEATRPAYEHLRRLFRNEHELLSLTDVPSGVPQVNLEESIVHRYGLTEAQRIERSRFIAANPALEGVIRDISGVGEDYYSRLITRGYVRPRADRFLKGQYVLPWASGGIDDLRGRLGEIEAQLETIPKGTAAYRTLDQRRYELRRKIAVIGQDIARVRRRQRDDEFEVRQWLGAPMASVPEREAKTLVSTFNAAAAERHSFMLRAMNGLPGFEETIGTIAGNATPAIIPTGVLGEQAIPISGGIFAGQRVRLSGMVNLNRVGAQPLSGLPRGRWLHDPAIPGIGDFTVQSGIRPGFRVGPGGLPLSTYEPIGTVAKQPPLLRAFDRAIGANLLYQDHYTQDFVPSVEVVGGQFAGRAGIPARGVRDSTYAEQALEHASREYNAMIRNTIGGTYTDPGSYTSLPLESQRLIERIAGRFEFVGPIEITPQSVAQELVGGLLATGMKANDVAISTEYSQALYAIYQDRGTDRFAGQVWNLLSDSLPGLEDVKVDEGIGAGSQLFAHFRSVARENIGSTRNFTREEFGKKVLDYQRSLGRERRMQLDFEGGFSDALAGVADPSSEFPEVTGELASLRRAYAHRILNLKARQARVMRAAEVASRDGDTGRMVQFRNQAEQIRKDIASIYGEMNFSQKHRVQRLIDEFEPTVVQGAEDAFDLLHLPGDAQRNIIRTTIRQIKEKKKSYSAALDVLQNGKSPEMVRSAAVQAKMHLDDLLRLEVQRSFFIHDTKGHSDIGHHLAEFQLLQRARHEQLSRVSKQMPPAVVKAIRDTAARVHGWTPQMKGAFDATFQGGTSNNPFYGFSAQEAFTKLTDFEGEFQYQLPAEVASNWKMLFRSGQPIPTIRARIPDRNSVRPISVHDLTRSDYHNISIVMEIMGDTSEDAQIQFLAATHLDDYIKVLRQTRTDSEIFTEEGGLTPSALQDVKELARAEFIGRGKNLRYTQQFRFLTPTLGGRLYSQEEIAERIRYQDQLRRLGRPVVGEIPTADTRHQALRRIEELNDRALASGKEPIFDALFMSKMDELSDRDLFRIINQRQLKAFNPAKASEPLERALGKAFSDDLDAITNMRTSLGIPEMGSIKKNIRAIAQAMSAKHIRETKLPGGVFLPVENQEGVEQFISAAGLKFDVAAVFRGLSESMSETNTVGRDRMVRDSYAAMHHVVHEMKVRNKRMSGKGWLEARAPHILGGRMPQVGGKTSFHAFDPAIDMLDAALRERGLSYDMLDEIHSAFGGEILELAKGAAPPDVLNTLGITNPQFFDRLFPILSRGNVLRVEGESRFNPSGRAPGLTLYEALGRLQGTFSYSREELENIVLSSDKALTREHLANMSMDDLQTIAAKLKPHDVIHPAEITDFIANALHRNVLQLQNEGVTSWMNQMRPGQGDRVMQAINAGREASGEEPRKPRRPRIPTKSTEEEAIESVGPWYRRASMAEAKELFQNNKLVRYGASGAAALAALGIVRSIRKRDHTPEDVSPAMDYPNMGTSTMSYGTPGGYRPIEYPGVTYHVVARGGDMDAFRKQIQNQTGGDVYGTMSPQGQRVDGKDNSDQMMRQYSG